MKHRKHEPHMSNETRIAILETTILNINSCLLEMRQDMKRLSDKIDDKFDAMDKKFEAKFDAIDNKFNGVNSKFDIMEKKFDAKFEAMDNKLERIQERIWSNFLWLMGMIIGLAGLIAHTQHWI